MKVLCLIVLFVAVATAADLIRCGQVIDGLSVDVDFLQVNSRVQASWSGFEDGKERNRVIRYEWAIISSDIASSPVFERECRITSGFRGLPDVYGWQNIGTATVALANNVNLVSGKKYFVVVRATTALGEQRYTNSDGFIAQSNIEENNLNTRSLENEKKKVTRDELPSGELECSIDQDWACNAAKVSVRERLDAVYGPASGQFLPFNLASATAFVLIPLGDLGTEIEPENNDDDDDGSASLNVGTIIGIGIGITAFFCLLTIGAIIIASFTGKGGAFGDGNVRQHQNVEEF